MTFYYKKLFVKLILKGFKKVYFLLQDYLVSLVITHSFLNKGNF